MMSARIILMHVPEQFEDTVENMNLESLKNSDWNVLQNAMES